LSVVSESSRRSPFDSPSPRERTGTHISSSREKQQVPRLGRAMVCASSLRMTIQKRWVPARLKSLRKKSGKRFPRGLKSARDQKKRDLSARLKSGPDTKRLQIGTFCIPPCRRKRATRAGHPAEDSGGVYCAFFWRAKHSSCNLASCERPSTIMHSSSAVLGSEPLSSL